MIDKTLRLLHVSLLVVLANSGEERVSYWQSKDANISEPRNAVTVDCST